MSIYATLWTLKFPKDEGIWPDSEWVQIVAQGVPAHIGSPTPGQGYEQGDPFGEFLPPPIETDENGDAEHLRAVVFVVARAAKGTERSAQEYASPLLVMTGDEYFRMSFEDLHGRLRDAIKA